MNIYVCKLIILLNEDKKYIIYLFYIDIYYEIYLTIIKLL